MRFVDRDELVGWDDGKRIIDYCSANTLAKI